MNLAVQRLFKECLALVDGDRPPPPCPPAPMLRERQPATLTSGPE